ncbi:MAG: class I SAM-dependent methyltransferase [Ignavibacterium sp.]|jgi:precorrin-6B methylase 2|nr:class I SAM-dependent methyltransferase [Ignavibacterium sp.]
MAFTFHQKIRTILKLLHEPKVLSALLSQREFGYLNEIGWFESFNALKSIDGNGNPLPWFSYPFIDFLTPRITKDLVVFEFGSGSSTSFFAERVKKVISIEHNNEWFEIVNKSRPKNVELILTDSDSANDYLNYFIALKDKADIVIVDGLHRNECLIKACDNLSSNGVIILDDSERPEYKIGIESITERGFKRLEFWGIAPTVLFKKCTTVFYKCDNCLKV